MPTANANTGNGFTKALSYIHQENKKLPDNLRPQVIEYNNVFGNSKEMGYQMREIAQERVTVKKPVLHVQINFHPDEKLPREQVQKAIDSILKDAGIKKDNHQYVVVQHQDKAHDHYHVVANRVGLDGTLMNDHRIKERLQVACDKVEKQQGLRPTNNRTVIYNPQKKEGFSYVNESDLKKERAVPNDKNAQKKEVKGYVQQSLINELAVAHSIEELKRRLESGLIETKLAVNKNGIYGVSFRYKEIAIKGNDIGFKWAQIRDRIALNREAGNNIPATALNQALGQKNFPKGSLSQQDLSGLLKSAYLTLLSRYPYDKEFDTGTLCDQACREYGKKLNPLNVWLAWNALPDHDQLYRQLKELADNSILLKIDPAKPKGLLEADDNMSRVSIGNIEGVPIHPHADGVLIKLQYNEAFKADFHLEVVQAWEDAGLHRQNNDRETVLSFLPSLTDQAIQRVSLDVNLITESDRELITGFIWDIIQGLMATGYSAQLNEEPERKRKMRR